MSSAGPCPYSARLPKERLIRCLQYYFREWNPGAPIGVIDWEGLADSSLTLAENLERFEREYPVFRWRPEGPEERARREILDEVARSIEAALNAGYRPSDIAKNLREALLKRGLTERQIQGILGALNLPEQPPAQPQPPPQAPSPPAQPPQPRRELRPEDVTAVQYALESRLRRPLLTTEYVRFEQECVAASKTIDDLEECAERLYEEFSKRPIQLSAARPRPAQPQPQERARPPARVTDRRGMALPVAGGRRELPISLGGGKAEMPIAPHRERVAGPPGWFPYVVVTCRRDGRVDVFRARTSDQAKETAAGFIEAGGKVLCYGLEDECREWVEKSKSGEVVDECVKYWEGYYGP
ncbi:MAG: hypothetical protein RXR82_08190 [Nitrososphaeria archaeon]